MHYVIGPFFVFYTESVMLGPRFIPESVFYTQSVMLSPRFIVLLLRAKNNPNCSFCDKSMKLPRMTNLYKVNIF